MLYDSTQRVLLNGYRVSALTVTCYLFIGCNKSTALYRVLIIGERMCRRGKEVYENRELSVQFFFKPKTSLKFNNFLKISKGEEPCYCVYINRAN